MTNQGGGEDRPGGRSSFRRERADQQHRGQGPTDRGRSDATSRRRRKRPPRPDPRHEARVTMVTDQVAHRGVRDERVLHALRAVPRHRFLPKHLRPNAYDDRAIGLGPGQSLSQPFVVATCTSLVLGDPWDGETPTRILEVGSGTGYQMAVLAEVVPEVFGIEIDEELAEQSQATLGQLAYRNCEVQQGDGWHGMPGAAPFDAILVTACADHAPPALRHQLAIGGRLIMPIGPSDQVQHLRVLTRMSSSEWDQQDVLAVQFVPMKRATEPKSASN